eukprot:TRINITY_DN11592_c0_g1_i1.p1 TRINITY_DN11592_c0_g1~~TRINITY_DN11592_c0_g1_i1.p1  ORF type:complete len:548 (+),score=148.89 TRINITY_DN11592_c0_g1_i1:93-1646(+)
MLPLAPVVAVFAAGAAAQGQGDELLEAAALPLLLEAARGTRHAATFGTSDDYSTTPSLVLCGAALRTCLPHLHKVSILSRWQTHQAVCTMRYCQCLPGGTYYPASGKCYHRRMGTCDVRERCFPIADSCARAFEAQYPLECDEFLNCSHSAAVERADNLDCIQRREREERLRGFGPCDNSKVCGHVDIDFGSDLQAQSPAVVVVPVGMVLLVMCYCYTKRRQRSAHRRRVLALMRAAGADLGTPPGEAASPCAPVAHYPRPAEARSRCAACGADPGVSAAELLLPCHCLLCPDCRLASAGEAAAAVSPQTPGAARGSEAEDRAQAERGSKPAGARAVALLRKAVLSAARRAPPQEEPAYTRCPERGASEDRSAPPAAPRCPSCAAEVERRVELARIFTTSRSSADRRPAESSCPTAGEGGGEAPPRSGPGAAAAEAADAEAPEHPPQEAAENTGLCIVCYEQDASVAFLPCGHMASCVTCAPLIASPSKGRGLCHLCREPIEFTVDMHGLSLRGSPA